MTRFSLRRRTVVLAVGALGMWGCTPADDDPAAIGVDAYSVAIAEFLPDEPVAEDGTRPIVYVARLGDAMFELDEQVAMIETIEATHDLRFVDSIEAALDHEEGEAPPREGGLLLGIGTVAPTEPHLVRVEVYGGSRDASAFLLTLQSDADRWRIETSEPVEPEVLVGDE